MTTSLAKLEARIAELEAAAEALRDATQEAHEAIQTLRLLKRDITELLGTEASTLVKEALTSQVESGLAEYAETIQEAQRQAVLRVSSQIDRLMRLYLGKENDPNYLPTLADRNQEQRRRT